MKILFFGDIIGRLGRKAIKQIMPLWQKEHEFDLAIANVENLAHGKGVTESTLKEILDAKIDLFTSGNHIFKKKEIMEMLDKYDLIIPANYPPSVPGKRFVIREIGAYRVLIANLMGRVLIKEGFDCPFRALDQLVEEANRQKVNAIVIDVHAEATSEKMGLLHYGAKKVSALLGTHTHVPTQDFGIYGTCAFVSDIGMVGAYPSVIGVNAENAVQEFLTLLPQPFELADTSWMEVNAVLVELDGKSGRATSIKKLREFINLENSERQEANPDFA